jgi:hypothetical protein
MCVLLVRRMKRWYGLYGTTLTCTSAFIRLVKTSTMGQHLETRICQAIDRGKNGLMFPLGLGFVRRKLPIGTE